jgi:polyhydroxyalkanoate synthase
MSHISSQDKEFFVLDAGHVGLLTGSEAKKELWPKIRSWLELRSK